MPSRSVLLGSVLLTVGCHVIEPVFGSALGHGDSQEQLSASLGSISRWRLPTPKVPSELDLSPWRGAGGATHGSVVRSAGQVHAKIPGKCASVVCPSSGL